MKINKKELLDEYNSILLSWDSNVDKVLLVVLDFGEMLGLRTLKHFMSSNYHLSIKYYNDKDKLLIDMNKLKNDTKSYRKEMRELYKIALGG